MVFTVFIFSVKIDNLLKFIYICLADNGLLYLYDISLTDGFAMAKESLESGKAFQVFKKFIMD